MALDVQRSRKSGRWDAWFWGGWIAKPWADLYDRCGSEIQNTYQDLRLSENYGVRHHHHVHFHHQQHHHQEQRQQQLHQHQQRHHHNRVHQHHHHHRRHRHCHRHRHYRHYRQLLILMQLSTVKEAANVFLILCFFCDLFSTTTAFSHF